MAEKHTLYAKPYYAGITNFTFVAFSALTLLVGRQEGHLGGVAPSRMVGVSASVNLPLHHEVQKFSSGTGSPEWSQKKGRKTVVIVVVQMSPL